MGARVIKYNEIDPYASQWMRNLIAEGAIAPGEVDERSIEDIYPDEVRHLTQFHTFAGIGVWSYALRLAGWPDDFPVWSGSAPCQPYSVAGKQEGEDDERHLWPAWFRLIEACRPACLFGEQVSSSEVVGRVGGASKRARKKAPVESGPVWIDAVRAQLEGIGYSVGFHVLTSAGAGAPHIRQRVYFCAFRNDGRVAHADRSTGGQGSSLGAGSDHRGDAEQGTGPRGGGGVDGLAYGASFGRERWGPGEADGGSVELERLRSAGGLADDDEAGLREQRGQGLPEDANAPHRYDADGRSTTHGLGDASGAGAGWNAGTDARAEAPGSGERLADWSVGDGAVAPGAVGGLGHHHNAGPQGLGWHGDDWRESRRVPAFAAGSIGAAGATRGFWADADWLFCQDGKWRPVEPGTFPLAYGSAADLGPDGAPGETRTAAPGSRAGRLKGYGNAVNAHLAAIFIRSAIEAYHLTFSSR